MKEGEKERSNIFPDSCLFYCEDEPNTNPRVRTVCTRWGPSLVIAAGRPSSNLRDLRMGLRRPPDRQNTEQKRKG